MIRAPKPENPENPFHLNQFAFRLLFCP